ncbi:MAG: kelch repeat-containing protein [bacterium]
MPDAREGACMAILNGNLYIFGGFSHSLLNDVKVFNFAEKNWRNIKPRDD